MLPARAPWWCDSRPVVRSRTQRVLPFRFHAARVASGERAASCVDSSVVGARVFTRPSGVIRWIAPLRSTETSAPSRSHAVASVVTAPTTQPRSSPHVRTSRSVSYSIVALLGARLVV